MVDSTGCVVARTQDRLFQATGAAEGQAGWCLFKADRGVWGGLNTSGAAQFVESVM